MPLAAGNPDPHSQCKVEAAKTTVHAALDDLDPVAKAQVLADLADS